MVKYFKKIMRITELISLITICICLIKVHHILQANAAECELQTSLDNNFLSPIDIFATSPESDIACIKARFSLAFKLESIEMVNLNEDDTVDQIPEKVIIGQDGNITDDQASGNRTMYYRAHVGYVPLEKLTSVEKTCPESINPFQQAKKNETTPNSNNNSNSSTTIMPDSSNTMTTEATNGATQNNQNENESGMSDDELEMIVKFECGKLAFTFKRDEDHSYLSSIVGVVQFDTQVSQFVYKKPILFTSSSNYHFKFDDPIQIVSEDSDGIWILTANLYLTEIETFRNTKNRDFIKPADKDSKPYLETPEPFNLSAAVDRLIKHRHT